MTTLASPPRTARDARGWRLGKQTGKAVLLVHILSAGTWFGLDIAMAVLVFAAIAPDSQATKELAYQALELLVIWPLLVASVLCLARPIARCSDTGGTPPLSHAGTRSANRAKTAAAVVRVLRP